MSAAAGLGTAWILFTCALGHALILWAAYRHIKRTMDLAQRGLQAEKEDLLVRQHERMTR